MTRTYPFEPCKIESSYGDPRNYGPHEGLDLNGLGGGNTDCGTLLYVSQTVEGAKAVFTSYSSAGYGRMLIIEVMTPRGPRYHRYAHLSEVLVKVGETITPDKPVAKMGSTGNSVYCHLHWDIFNQMPPSGNWRWYPKTRAELEDYMIDPKEWINVYKDYKPSSTMPKTTYTQEQWDKLKDENQDNWDKWQDALKEVEQLKRTVDSKETTVKRLQDQHQSYLDELSKILWSEGEPTLSDGEKIREKVEDLKKEILALRKELDDKEDAKLALEDKLNRERQDAKSAYLAYEDKLGKLKEEMRLMREDYERKLANVEARVDQEIAALRAEKKQYELTTRVFNWFTKLFSERKS